MKACDDPAQDHSGASFLRLKSDSVYTLNQTAMLLRVGALPKILGQPGGFDQFGQDPETRKCEPSRQGFGSAPDAYPRSGRAAEWSFRPPDQRRRRGRSVGRAARGHGLTEVKAALRIILCPLRLALPNLDSFWPAAMSRPASVRTASAAFTKPGPLMQPTSVRGLRHDGVCTDRPRAVLTRGHRGAEWSGSARSSPARATWARALGPRRARNRA